MDTISNKKICKSCRESKDLNEFYKDNRLKGGYKNDCKKCQSVKMQKYYPAKSRQPKDEFLLAIQKFSSDINDIGQRLVLCRDPDELKKLKDENIQLIEKHEQTLSERHSCSFFSISDNGQDDIFIQGKVQEFIIPNKRVVIIPDEIAIKRVNRIIKITLPTRIKLSPEERSKLIKILTGK
jgi:hypothetical protein